MKIEKGTIKVVWIAKNRKRIHSKMFENIKLADKFGKTKGDCIIFKLIKEKNMNEFEWEILPYGKYKTYDLILNLYSKEKLLGL
ncbi:MAG: hypothetical protein AABX93_01020 [Nanoarchaeota archaeon]